METKREQIITTIKTMYKGRDRGIPYGCLKELIDSKQEQELDSIINLLNDIDKFTKKLKLTGISISFYPAIEYEANQSYIVPELRELETYNKDFTFDCGRINKGNIIINKKVLHEIFKNKYIKLDISNLNIILLGKMSSSIFSMCEYMSISNSPIIYNEQSIYRLLDYLHKEIEQRRPRIYKDIWFEWHIKALGNLLVAKERLQTGKICRSTHKLVYTIQSLDGYGDKSPSQTDALMDILNSIENIIKSNNLQVYNVDYENTIEHITKSLDTIIKEAQQ